MVVHVIFRNLEGAGLTEFPNIGQATNLQKL